MFDHDWRNCILCCDLLSIGEFQIATEHVEVGTKYFSSIVFCYACRASPNAVHCKGPVYLKIPS